MFKLSSSGRELIIDVRVKGETFASLAAVAGKPSFASTRAAEDVTLVAFRRAHLISLLERNPALVLKIMESEASKLLNIYSKLINFATNTATQRLVYTLLILSSKYGVNLSYTHQEVAEMSGTTTETVTRIFSRLKREGAIQLTRGNLVVVNTNKLQSLM